MELGVGSTLGLVDLGSHEHALSLDYIQLRKSFGEAIENGLRFHLITSLKRGKQLSLLHSEFVARPDYHVSLLILKG